jgi:hypothetical protein
MKRLTDKDIQMISAYLDGELSDAEKELLEKRISESSGFQEKFEEMKKIKNLTSNSFNALPEKEYFETRVMQKIHSGNSSKLKIRKWAPVVGFSILTIGLMLILKFNPSVLDRLVETQKTKIAGFYQENLKPLLFAANLTNDDIFNFAFYKQLPLDKSNNQYIQLSTDSSGNEYFEIKKTNDVPASDNLNRFITALNLNSQQKEQVDSIINSYAQELQSQILVNDKNTVAINPNLWNYNKALVADLYAFASKTKSKEFAKIIPASYHYINQSEVARAVREIKANKNDQYIFIAPDTIFSEKYAFDRAKFGKEMLELKKNLKNLNKETENYSYKFDFSADSDLGKNSIKIDSTWIKNFVVKIDSNLCKVQIPKIIISPPLLPNFDSIFSNLKLEELTEGMKKLTFEMPKGFPEKGGEIKMKFMEGDSLKTLKFNMNPINVDSIVQSSLKVLDSLNIYMPKNIHINIDSLLNNKIYHNAGDSHRRINSREYKKIIKDHEKEIQKLRREMEKMEKNYKRDSLYQHPDTIKS